MDFDVQEDFGNNYTSEEEWDRYEAELEGAKRPDDCWICSGRDAWYRNPYYEGQDTPHPEEISHCG